MTEIESLYIYYNYILNTLRKEDKIMASSVITAGVEPRNDCLKKLIEICFPNVRNPNNNSKYFGVAVPSLEVENKNDNNNGLRKI